MKFVPFSRRKKIKIHFIPHYSGNINTSNESLDSSRSLKKKTDFKFMPIKFNSGLGMSIIIKNDFKCH